MEGSRKAVLVALAANIGIATAKFVGYFFTGSASILAEAFHSVADTTDQLLLLFGRYRARRVATPEHPFGYGMERFFWAFVVSMLIFSMGGLVAIYNGVDKILHPEPVTQPAWGFGILVVALVLDGISLFNARRTANKGRRSWQRYVKTAKEPEVMVILLEDSAAVTGVMLALVGFGLTVWTGDPLYDGLGSIAVGLLLAAMAFVLARETKSLLIGESASPERQQAIEEAIGQHEAVRKLVYARTLHLGPEELMVEAKLVFDPALTVRELALIIDEIEDRIRSRVAIVRTIALEPDVPRSNDPDRPPWS